MWTVVVQMEQPLVLCFLFIHNQVISKLLCPMTDKSNIRSEIRISFLEDKEKLKHIDKV